MNARAIIEKLSSDKALAAFHQAMQVGTEWMRANYLNTFKMLGVKGGKQVQLMVTPGEEVRLHVVSVSKKGVEFQPLLAARWDSGPATSFLTWPSDTLPMGIDGHGAFLIYTPDNRPWLRYHQVR